MTDMTGHPDVLIIGGGVIGLTTAYYLAQDGVTVLVLDQAELGRQASWAGAGIIPPGNSRRAKLPYDLLRAHSAEMYPVLSHELRQRTGVDNGYVVCGGLENADESEPLPLDAWRDEGIAFEEWDARQLHEQMPYVGPTLARSYFLPGMAQVRNPRHLQALITGCRLLGVHLQPECAVRGLVREGAAIAAVETTAGRLTAAKYLVAAGAWSDRLLKEVGLQPGVRPVRGQIALLQTESALRPILLQGKRYLVPRLDGRVLVGSTEEEAGFDTRPTAGAIEELLSFAVSLVPELADAALERCWAGLRPGTPDGLPFLGKVPDVSNLFVAAGHYRAGIQLSPATGLVLKQLLTQQTPLIPLADFGLNRPAAPSGETAFRS
jgi:glycine oxidase